MLFPVRKCTFHYVTAVFINGCKPVNPDRVQTQVCSRSCDRNCIYLMEPALETAFCIGNIREQFMPPYKLALGRFNGQPYMQAYYCSVTKQRQSACPTAWRRGQTIKKSSNAKISPRSEIDVILTPAT